MAFSSHPNSRDSSPTSRDVDNDTANNDEPRSTDAATTTTYKVKFICSYGGKIQPRPHDNHLSYVGGDSKILAVDRNIKFSAIMTKLSSLANNADVCFKYQLPGEDLDALISVTNDEDLHHMMVEYDRLCRASPPKPARMRLILFPLTSPCSAAPNFGPTEPKPERQWFVEALNSVQIPNLERFSPPPNPDFLFGLDKPYPPPVPETKPPDAAVPDFAAKDAECGPEGEEPDAQKQIHEELQKLQLGNNEQQLLQLKNDEENGVNGVDCCYHQMNTEKVTPLTSQPHLRQVHSGPVHASFFPSGGYSLATGSEPAPVYLIQTASGIYQAFRPVTVTAAPVGPTYYAVPRMVPASAAQVYNAASFSLSHSHSASKIGYSDSSQVGVVSEHGYSQVAHLPERSVGWN